LPNYARILYECVQEKPKSVTHQPNQSLNLDGDRDVPEGLFGKKNLSFETLFRSRPHQPKKKELFALFFSKPDLV
jgi:hypothetical protein